MGLEKMELKANGIRGTRQTFKIACPNEPIDKVLDALPFGVSLADHGIRLQDVDITKDFAGSFDRTTLRNHMLTNHGFRMQNRRHNVMDLDDKYAFVDKDDDMEDGEDALDTPTILRNTKSVGGNCLTYMDKHNGHPIRSKVYNKFVQSLESASVVGNMGYHLWDWCNNPGSRLRETIDRSLEHGLTRVEVTFYNVVPTMWDIEYVLGRWQEYVVRDICFSTPPRKQWEALAEQVKSNTMVVCEKTRQILLAHWANQYTGKVGGIYRKCFPKEDFATTVQWIASELTFDLPIHILYLHVDKKEDMLEIGTRSFRKVGDKDPRVRMVESVHIYKHWGETEEMRSKTPEEMGMPPTGPLNFYIATKRANKGSKRRFGFEELEIIRQPVLIGQKTAAKMLVDTNTTKERERYLAEKMDLRRQVAEQKILDKLRKEEEGKRLQTAYLALYQATPKKFGPDNVGKTFQVHAIGESYGRYGAYYFLRTDQCVYYSDPTSKRSIPNILRYVRQDTHKGRKIYSLLGKEIYSVKVEAWRRASHSGYYYAATSLPLPRG
ncbi:unnamed protein product [Mytilus coruscus]|uniref:Uncharacterized protein n=1 Tax=Mytilus coruscus TaxID=42192 RepID=A0A6J8CEA2_MYTCO|nr:unnamed protein product [Mytilus coruscus]